MLSPFTLSVDHRQLRSLPAFLYLLVTLLFTTTAWAQFTAPSSRLWQTLRQHPQADRQRVDLLNQLADLDLRQIESIEFTATDQSRVDSLTKLAYSLAQQLGYTRGAAYAEFLNPSLVLATRLKRASQPFDGQQWLKAEFIPLLERLHDNRLLSGAMAWSLTYDTQTKNHPRYLQRLLTTAQASHLPRVLCHAYRTRGFYYRRKGDYYQGLQNFFQQRYTAQQAGLVDEEANALVNLGDMYVNIADYPQSLTYYQQAVANANRVASATYRMRVQQSALIGLGYGNLRASNYPQALAAFQQAAQLGAPTSKKTLQAKRLIATVYYRQHNPGMLSYARRILRLAQAQQQPGNYGSLFLTLGRYYLENKQPDSAVVNGQKALFFLSKYWGKEDEVDALKFLGQAYAANRQYAQAYSYQNRYLNLQDTLSSEKLTRQAVTLRFSQDMERQRTQITRLTNSQQRQAIAARRQRTWLLAISGGVALLVLLAGVLYAAFRRSQRLAQLVTVQKQNLQQQRDQLDTSLTELRATQAQLIQKEKMASLGELTAGIAHEIQNPLNFVNNFSDVSAELVTELDEALAADDKEEAVALATDLRQNLTKIHQHGQRASSIVRGMLEHSRQSTGERQPTDVNQLASEYLRLAYQGLRAKDQSFNAELQTDLAADLPPVEAVPGDLGRVLLNLFTNAFYAVQQRQRAGQAGYVPTVSVHTQQVGQQVLIQVQDNGTGMSPEVQAKVFQPFFTTKPTGEGTGLGLSLSYDIVTKGHGGMLAVESQPGQGSTFIISLPTA